VSLRAIGENPSVRSMMPNEHVSTTDSDFAVNGVSPAERLLLDIIDTVREPLLVLESDFRVRHANQSFFRTFRVSAEDTLGETLFDLGDGQWNIPALRALLKERLVDERELFDLDVDHVFPGVGRRIMLVNARLVNRGRNLPLVILLAIEDVTEQRFSARRLAAQHRELQRSNAALSEFAFVASHDLQEPLRKILSFGERLETSAGSSLQGNARHYLERMLNAAARMRTLVSDVLTYSQVAVRTEPFTPTDLGAIAREVVLDLEATVTENDAHIDVGALPIIEADALQMRQLLQNLLGNALKFRRRDVKSVVQLHALESGDGFCTIAVTDNGIGIREEHREKIFRMFERLHNRAQYDGSGIGLAICRRIVERHGGSIAVTGTTGGGTTFSVTLPVTHAEVE
jgi:signal transduction histidine kinase